MSDPRVESVKALVGPWCQTPDEAEALAISVVRELFADVGTGIQGDNHALLVGRLVGLLLKDDEGEHSGFYPLRPEPVMRGRDYTNKIVVSQPSGKYVITVETIGEHQ